MLRTGDFPGATFGKWEIAHCARFKTLFKGERRKAPSLSARSRLCLANSSRAASKLYRTHRAQSFILLVGVTPTIRPAEPLNFSQMPKFYA